MCKLDVKDAYFFSSTASVIKKICSVFMVREPLLVTLLMWGPVLRIFIKLLKKPMPVLRRINIWIIIYLDDMLIMGQTMEEIRMSRDTLIFLLQHLGFVLNLEKSILNPVQETEFLWVTITSLKMGLSLLKKNQLKIQSHYQDVHAKGQVTIHLEKLQTSKIDRSSYLKNSGRFASSGKLLISSQIKALRATQGYSSTAIQRRNFSDGSKISRSSMGVT